MHQATIERVEVSAHRIPTDFPEADGTLAWDSTTMVLARVQGGGRQGLGYTYAHEAAATLIQDKLKGAVEGGDAMNLPGAWQAMVGAVRNLGSPGIAASAISAVDTALWNLKARLLDLPLVSLLGACRELKRKAVVHFHCNHHTVLKPDAEREVLERLRLDLRVPDSGCCGMAGSFGFEKEHYEVAMKCGKRVLLPAVRDADEDALIIVNGFSCREQIAQATDRQALHIAQVIRMAMQEAGKGAATTFPERRCLEIDGLPG